MIITLLAEVGSNPRSALYFPSLASRIPCLVQPSLTIANGLRSVPFHAPACSSLTVFLSQASLRLRRLDLLASVTNPAGSLRFNLYAGISSPALVATRQLLPNGDPASLACFVLNTVRRPNSRSLYC
jgi:hypothetical protein